MTHTLLDLSFLDGDSPPALAPDWGGRPSHPEPWDRDAANTLVVDADGLCERLGVDGRTPEVAAAAGGVAAALNAGDMAKLRAAVAAFAAVVRRVASEA